MSLDTARRNANGDQSDQAYARTLALIAIAEAVEGILAEIRGQRQERVRLDEAILALVGTDGDESDDDPECLPESCICGHRSLDHFGGGACLPDAAFTCTCKVYRAAGGQA